MKHIFNDYIQDVDTLLCVGDGIHDDFLRVANENIVEVYDIASLPKGKKVAALLISDDIKLVSCIRHLEDNGMVFMISTNANFVNKVADSILFRKMYSRNGEHVLSYIRPRIGIVTFAVGNEYIETVTPGIISKNNYVNIHNYNLLFDPLSLDNTRPLSWSKIRQVQRFLRMYDVLMWIDADTIITNPNVCIEDILLMMPKSKDLMIGRDINDLNAGVFIIRNSIRSFEFLNEVWSQNDLIHNGWWEQAAIIRLTQEKYNDIAVEIPRNAIRIFNAYIPQIDPLHNHQPGDFIIHFAGTKGQMLYDLMRTYAIDSNAPPDNTHTLIYRMLCA